MTFAHCRQPCAECPWRLDVEPGKFPASRFRATVTTAIDTSMTLFACHLTPDGEEKTCAGFLLSEDAMHNLSVRLAGGRGDLDLDQLRKTAAKLKLKTHANFFRLALANGVAGDDPVLLLLRKDCRQ